MRGVAAALPPLACYLSVVLPSATAFAVAGAGPAASSRRHGAGSSTAYTGLAFAGSTVRGGVCFMSSTGDGTLSREETLVQYVLVRRDLQTSLGWPLGSVIAQGCHAVSALMWEKRENSNVAKYCANIDSMHKVVLGVKDSKELLKFAQKLSDADMQHRVWVEQPENDPTALAVLPYPRSQIQPLLKKLPLLK